MNQFRRFRKNKDVTKQKLNKVKSTTLKLSLIMLNFIFATLAWFTYTMILDTTVDVKVSAWKVDFKDDTAVLGTDMSFQIENFYPGMEADEYAKKLEIVNLGDRPASIEYEIKELKILGQRYQIKKEASAGDSAYTLYIGESIDEETGIKTTRLLNNSNKYPFEILLTQSIQIGIETPYDDKQNQGYFEIRFKWPYEITSLPENIPTDLPESVTSEEDILKELNTRKTLLDTQWGYDIANFYNEQENLEEEAKEQGIEITLQVIAKQVI